MKIILNTKHSHRMRITSLHHAHLPLQSPHKQPPVPPLHNFLLNLPHTITRIQYPQQLVSQFCYLVIYCELVLCIGLEGQSLELLLYCGIVDLCREAGYAGGCLLVEWGE